MTERKKTGSRPLLRSMESSTYKAIFAEGQRTGVESMKRTCLHLVAAKLGTLPAEARAIEHMDDLETLERLSSKLIDAADPEAVRTALRSFGGMTETERILAEFCALLRSMGSSTYKAIFAEGERSGERKGELSGERKGERKALEMIKRSCLHLVEARLGSLPPEAEAIEQIVDLDRAVQLSSQIIAAADPEAVRTVLRSLEK